MVTENERAEKRMSQPSNEEVVRAIYDFESRDPEELSFFAGDLIIVLNHGTGDGWWEGKRNGVLGLFPDNYVESISEIFNLDESDFSDFEEGIEEPKEPQTLEAVHSIGISEEITDEKTIQAIKGLKTINRFSYYANGGAEVFFLEGSRSNPPYEKSYHIQNDSQWQTDGEQVYVTLSDPQKQTEFGLKKYIDYKIYNTKTGTTVRRRFRDFEWLLKVFRGSHGCLALSGLPLREVDRRQELLCRWINRIGRHPVLSRAQVFHDFLNRTENGKAWKDFVTNYKDAEPNTVLEGIMRPGSRINQEHLICEVKVVAALLDRSVHSSNKLTENANGFASLCSSMGNQYNALGDSFSALANDGPEGTMIPCWRDNCPECKIISKNLAVTSQLFSSIGKMTNALQKQEFIRLADDASDYNHFVKGLEVPVDLQENVCQKLRQTNQMVHQGKLEIDVADSIKDRGDTITYVCQSDVNWIHEERVASLGLMTKTLLTKQLAYHNEVVRKIENALNSLEEVQTKEGPGLGYTPTIKRARGFTMN